MENGGWSIGDWRLEIGEFEAAAGGSFLKNEGATVLDVKKQDPVSKVDCGGSWH
jgi:hypothetical protein